MSLHLIDKKGKRIEVKSGECPPEGCSVDLEWYKANGYISWIFALSALFLLFLLPT